MKVALVHEMLAKMGGAENVLEELTKIFPEAPIYTLVYDEKNCGKVFPKEKIRVSSIQKFLDWGVPRQFLVTKMSKAIEDFDFSEFDVVISSSSAFAHGIIVPSSVKHICYVHAPMRYVWDYAHQYLQEKAPKRGMKRFLMEKITHQLRMWDFVAASRPDVLLANSTTTQKRIQKFWRRESQVVFPPVDTQRFSPQKENKNYFFIVSALEPFKKIDLAVEVMKFFPNEKLIIAGDGSHREALEKMAGENIKFLGRQSNEEVKSLMENCKAFLFPGLEDFGIAPVEAMASGKPVVYFGEGGLTDSMIDGKTGISFAEQTPESMQKSMEKFLENAEFFQENFLEIRKQAEKFSTEKFVENIKKSLFSDISK